VSAWFTIVETSHFHLWRDEPAANQLKLSCTHGELEALVDALAAAVPAEKRREHQKYARLHAEVKKRASGDVRRVNLYLSGTNAEQPGLLHTGNGVGDWIETNDEIRIVGFDDTY